MNQVIEQLDPLENPKLALNFTFIGSKLYEMLEAQIYIVTTLTTITFAKKNNDSYDVLSVIDIDKLDCIQKLKKYNIENKGNIDLNDSFHYVHQLSETSLELRLLFKKGNSLIACKGWFNNFKLINHNTVFLVDTYPEDTVVDFSPKDMLTIEHSHQKMGKFKVYFKDGREPVMMDELFTKFTY